MREIRFRAWDDIEGKYHYDVSISDGIAESSWGKEKPEWIIEQFTGLLDKNGKPIYEGDVIKSIDIDEYCDERTITEKIEAVGSLNKYIETLSWIPKHGEVIGTIHDAEYKELAK